MTPPPRVVRPVIAMSAPNEPVALGDGEMTLRVEGQERLLEGKLTLDWLPSPRIWFRGDLQGSWAPEFLGPGTIEVDGWVRENPCVVVTARHREGGSYPVGGFLSSPAARGDLLDEVNELRFALVNFPSYRGREVCDVEARSWLNGRLDFEFGSWEVTVDQLSRPWEFRDALEATGGYAVTHSARLRRFDRTLFTYAQAKPAVEALGYWLGFTAGAWCGPLLVSGFRSGEMRWQDLEIPFLDSWRAVRNWLPRVTELDFGESGSVFLRLWEQEEWNEALRLAVGWYRLANTSETLETPVVIGQAALESLSWTLVSETEGIIRPSGFSGLPAADKVRVLCTRLGVPFRRLPPSMAALIAHMKALGDDDDEGDIPGILVQVRNTLIHSSRKKRRRQAPPAAMNEAAELTLGLIELLMLSLFQYRGHYRDRLRQWGKGGLVSEERVPWIARAE